MWPWHIRKIGDPWESTKKTALHRWHKGSQPGEMLVNFKFWWDRNSSRSFFQKHPELGLHRLSQSAALGALSADVCSAVFQSTQLKTFWSQFWSSCWVISFPTFAPKSSKNGCSRSFGLQVMVKSNVLLMVGPLRKNQEMKPYVLLAERLGYVIHVVEPWEICAKPLDETVEDPPKRSFDQGRLKVEMGYSGHLLISSWHLLIVLLKWLEVCDHWITVSPSTSCQLQARRSPLFVLAAWHHATARKTHRAGEEAAAVNAEELSADTRPCGACWGAQIPKVSIVLAKDDPIISWTVI